MREGVKVNMERRIPFYQFFVWLVQTLFDREGKYLEVDQISVLSMKRLRSNAPEQFEILRQVVSCALHGNYFTETVKAYVLESEYFTPEIYAQRVGMKENTFRTQLTRGRKRFVEEFGEDCLAELSDLYGNQHLTNGWLSRERLKRYNDLLMSKQDMLGKIQDYLLIDISPYAEKEIDSMSREEFQRNCEELRHYTKKDYDQFLKQCESNGFFGYVYHLMNKVYKDDREQEDFSLILEMMEEKSPMACEAI